MLHKILSALVATPSQFPNEKNATMHVAKKLKSFGFQVQEQQVAKNRKNILAYKGKGKALLLYGHLDTVALTDGWKTDPYRLTQKGDKLFGLGAWDMKGGVAAILSAVSQFEPKGFCLKLAFTVDEENYSQGMHTLVQSGWLKNVFGTIAPEPGFDYGLAGIAMGRIGRSVYKIIIKTQGGHVYKVAERKNAILESLKIIAALHTMKKVRHKQLGDFIIFPRFITGGANAMSVPNEVVIELETQLVPPQTTESVLQELRQLISRLLIESKIEVQPLDRPTPFCQSFTIAKTNLFVKQVSHVLHGIIGKQPTYYYRRSVADENRIAALGVPVLTIGPDGGNAHEPNEWVSEKSLVQLEIFLKALLISYNKVRYNVK